MDLSTCTASAYISGDAPYRPSRLPGQEGAFLTIAERSKSGKQISGLAPHRPMLPEMLDIISLEWPVRYAQSQPR